MAVPATADDFLALVRKSGVVDSDLLESFVVRAQEIDPPFADPQHLATAMYRAGLLSKLQTSYLLQGKWRNWVLSGKYRILEHLGSGGMGQVFLCEHLRMRRLVAIKIMPPEKSDDAVLMQRFVREARSAATLNHPNIVRAYDLDSDGKLHFIVLEYVDGTSLDKIVAKWGPLSVERACDYIRQAACGLQHAHENSLVHRDIKPANLLLERSGVVKIHDLGLARCHIDPQNITQQLGGKHLIGTADYLAPEQAMNSHTVDIRADIYSLGATFYFLLTGQCPFPTGTIAQKLVSHQKHLPESVRSLRPEVPAEIDAIIQRMLAKEPSERFAEPADVIAALDPWAPQSLPPPDARELPHMSRAVRRFESQTTPLPGSLRTTAPPRSRSGSATPRPTRAHKFTWLRPASNRAKSYVGLALILIIAVAGAAVLYSLRGD